MHLSSRVKAQLLVMVATLAISASTASPTLAGRRPQPVSGSAVCLVTPNPVKIGVGTYTVWGSGFPAGMIVNIDVMGATGGVKLLAQAAADGTFGISAYAQFNSAGTQNVYVHDSLSRKYTLMAQCSFSAVY